MTNMTKKINPVILASVLATTILSMSQAAAFERGGQRSEGGFTRMDIDQDGLLSLEEMTAPMMTKSTKKFTRKDTDGDGFLTLEEFQQRRNGTAVNLAEIANELVLCVSDAKTESGDENIIVPSVDQFLSIEDKFANIDTDSDGVISLEELQAKIIDKIALAFITMDQDADNFVNEDEFNAANIVRSATKQAVRQCLEEINADEII
ncbi:MAG: Ca2+-binding EF-hand superfamily protein [Alteromonadaceae bacterium]|jgi:Ca2+-binding EF-hand superfamily protein